MLRVFALVALLPMGCVRCTRPALTVHLEGDSTMFGSNPGMSNGVVFGQTPKNPPALIQHHLEDLNVRVVNEARPGSNSQDTIDGGAGYRERFEDRMDKSNALVVVTNTALNDAAKPIPVEQYKKNLEYWVDTVRRFGKFPVLEEPNPTTCNSLELLPDYVQTMRNVAKDKSVVLIRQYDEILAIENWQEMLQDCEHPNDEMNIIKAERTAGALRQVILTNFSEEKSRLPNPDKSQSPSK